MGLAGPSHAIGKAGHIEAIHNIWDQRLHTRVVDLLIRYAVSENDFELERFVTGPVLDLINRLGCIINNIDLMISG